MAVGSQFTHATLPPAFTCTLAGWKVKSRMKMTVAPAVLDGAEQVAVLTVPFDVARSEKHATMPSETRTIDIAMRADAFGREDRRIVI